MDPNTSLQCGRLAGNRQNSSSSSLLSKTLSNASTQSLSSILNNPLVSDSSWDGWWSSSPAVQIPEFAPPSGNKTSCVEIHRSDFTSYLSSISDHFSRFEDLRNHSNKESNEDAIDLHERAGEALVTCLREVPALYFKEDFALEDGATFRASSSFSTVAESGVYLELNQIISLLSYNKKCKRGLFFQSIFSLISPVKQI